jgi:hypothetical protein
MMTTQIHLEPLDVQRAKFCQRRFLAMPIAGTICWALVGIAGAFVSTEVAALVLFIATGSIFYLAMLVARFTGEKLFHKDKNTFDRLFMSGVVMALLVYAIAIPFFLQDPTSLPLTVGILTGLMWLPFSWIVQHWVGAFHSISRTLLIVAAWYLFPELRFVVIPAVIVVIYAVSIYALEQRWRNLPRDPLNN